MNEKTEKVGKMILQFLLITGFIGAAAVSPRFASTVMRLMKNDAAYKSGLKRKTNREYYNAFYYLRRRGLINIRFNGQQMYISLTKAGKKLAGRYQIDDLKIKKQKKWDKIWRILIFDIKDKQKVKREALRGKLKELNLYQLQKSVWVYPYDFKKEMVLLRDFFGLTDKEMNIIEAAKIENDAQIRKFYNLG